MCASVVEFESAHACLFLCTTATAADAAGRGGRLEAEAGVAPWARRGEVARDDEAEESGRVAALAAAGLGRAFAAGEAAAGAAVAGLEAALLAVAGLVAVAVDRLGVSARLAPAAAVVRPAAGFELMLQTRSAEASSQWRLLHALSTTSNERRATSRVLYLHTLVRAS